jgi:hypothetical protein
MSKEELTELLRLVSAGRRDAADRLADLLHPLLKQETKAKPAK